MGIEGRVAGSFGLAAGGRVCRGAGELNPGRPARAVKPGEIPVGTLGELNPGRPAGAVMGWL